MSEPRTIRIAFEASETACLVEFCRTFLEENGYTVEKALLRTPRRETLPQLCRRLRVHWKVASRRLRHPACPAHDARRGASGRLVWVVSNGEVDAFLQMPIGTGVSAVAKLNRGGAETPAAEQRDGFEEWFELFGHDHGVAQETVAAMRAAWKAGILNTETRRKI